MKRYRVETSYGLNCTARMVEDVSGKWVRYDEVRHMIQEIAKDYNNEKELMDKFDLK